MKISVTSPSFCANAQLRMELESSFTQLNLNLKGKRFNKSELISFIGDSHGVIVGLELIDTEVLDACPNLKIISKYGVGLNNIDLDECKKRGIKIGWTGGVNKLSVAEMTLGYMLMLSRNLFVTSIQLKQGRWNKSGGFQLSNKVVGIIGVGHIGKEVIRLLKPFNCQVLVNDIIGQEAYYLQNNLTVCTKEEIYRKADVVTVHTPYDDTTHNMINADVFKLMKSESLLINSARGGIINEEDLKKALLSGEIGGAAVDAYVEEPPTDKDLLSIENLVCTPHIGGNSQEAILAMGQSAIKHILIFFKGSSQ